MDVTREPPAEAPRSAPAEASNPPPPEIRRVSRTRLVIGLVLMTILLGVLGYGLNWFDAFRGKMIANVFANMKMPPSPVVPAVVESTELPKSLSGIGTLQAVHQVTVSPEVGGKVVQIFFESGGTVQAGDSLVQLYDRNERADLLTYQAQAKLAKANLDRSRALIARQFETQANIDSLTSQLDVADANIARSQSLISQKVVRAPFAGMLGVRQIDLGQFVDAGKAIVTLTDLSNLYVNFSLPEQARSQIEIGQTVTVKVDAYPDRAFTATLTAIEPQIDQTTRQISLQATLPNPDQVLLPGMFAEAQLNLPPQPGVMMVPETAIDYSLYGESVYLIVENGADADGKPAFKVVRTPVKTAGRFNGKVAIASGVSVGQRVVISGQLKLQDNAAVVISSEQVLTPPATPSRP